MPLIGFKAMHYNLLEIYFYLAFSVELIVALFLKSQPINTKNVSVVHNPSYKAKQNLKLPTKTSNKKKFLVSIKVYIAWARIK